MRAVDPLTRDRIPEWISGSEGMVFVDVWGPRCAPCLVLSPTYERVAEMHRDRGRFLKLEGPANRMACVDLGVMGMPTFLAFRSGVEVGRLTGDIGHETLEQWIVEFFEDQVSKENNGG